MVKIRWDLVPCLLLGGLLYTLVTFAGGKYAENAYERWETQEIAEGEIGGLPSSDTPRVRSIAEMKENNTFYVVTKDTTFDSYHLFAENESWNALELPSGEVICVKVNLTSCKDSDNYSEVQTPVGKLVKHKLPDTLAEQLENERDMKFSDMSFYVDMNGKRLDYPNEEKIKDRFELAAGLIFFIAMIGSHMLGVKIGLLPPIFPKRRKEE